MYYIVQSKSPLLRVNIINYEQYYAGPPPPFARYTPAGTSRHHHGGQLRAPETSSRYYAAEGFKEGPEFSAHYYIEDWYTLETGKKIED